jgi:hypothetical protein
LKEFRVTDFISSYDIVYLIQVREVALPGASSRVDAPGELDNQGRLCRVGYQVRAVGKGGKHRKPLNEVALSWTVLAAF